MINNKITCCFEVFFPNTNNVKAISKLLALSETEHSENNNTNNHKKGRLNNLALSIRTLELSKHDIANQLFFE
jgi:hypothetical protein